MTATTETQTSPSIDKTLRYADKYGWNVDQETGQYPGGREFLRLTLRHPNFPRDMAVALWSLHPKGYRALYAFLNRKRVRIGHLHQVMRKVGENV